jgi:hypothetical protein
MKNTGYLYRKPAAGYEQTMGIYLTHLHGCAVQAFRLPCRGAVVEDD